MPCAGTLEIPPLQQPAVERCGIALRREHRRCLRRIEREDEEDDRDRARADQHQVFPRQ